MFDLIGASAIDLSVDLARESLEIWQNIYHDIVRGSSPFWQAINYGAFIIFGCGMINLVLNFNSNSATFAQQTITREIVTLFVRPFFIFIFLTGSGYIILIIMNASMDVASYGIYRLINFDILGTSLEEAIVTMHTNALINREILQIFGDCLSGSQANLTECFNDGGRISQVQNLASSLAAIPNVQMLKGNLLSVLMNNFQNSYSFDTDKLREILGQPGWGLNSAIWSINIFIWDLYLSLLNGWQSSLVMLAILGQLYLAMSIVPAWSNYFSSWLKKWIGHFEIFFKYTVITGLIAVFILQLSERSIAVGTVNTDLTYSTTLVVAPIFLWMTSVMGAKKDTQVNGTNSSNSQDGATGIVTDTTMSGIHGVRKVLR
ncbi:MAG: hypothetical protein ACFBSE_02370 [Prochloraceae cyanobacterium]